MDMVEHLRKIASSGGKATLAKHGIEQMTKWGRLGGRPRGKKRRVSHSGSFAKAN